MTVLDLVREAFAEDLPDGDLTTDHLQLKEKKGYAFLIAKADLRFSGKEFFETSMKYLSPQCEIKWFFNDGDTILKTQKVASIHGNLLEIIKGERVALNFLGYLSGIATLTHLFVSACEPGSSLRVLDTRKTLAPYREWAKKAVRDGGGLNHRMNLSDAVLIKENHIRIAGGIPQAVQQIREQIDGPIEVEVTNLTEVQQAVDLKVQRVLLDNMPNSVLQEALNLIPDEIETEASGNMSIERMESLSRLHGLDFVSVGALTHSAPVADFSLLFDF